MPVILGLGRRQQKSGTGYFYCPTCRARKPCTLYSDATYFTVFFIPLIPVGSEGGQRYECEGCHQSFDADARFHYDFGDHANPKTWTCSRCKSNNPSHAMYCQACGGS